MSDDWRPDFLAALGELCDRYGVAELDTCGCCGIWVTRDDDKRELQRVSVSHGKAWGDSWERSPAQGDADYVPLPYNDPTLSRTERLRAEIAWLQEQAVASTP